MLFVEYPKCTTCQKAKKWLDENGLSYTDRHIKEENPTYDELKAWHAKSGLPLRSFFNHPFLCRCRGAVEPISSLLQSFASPNLKLCRHPDCPSA